MSYQESCQKGPGLERDGINREWVPSGEWQFNVKGALKALDMLRQMLPEMKQDEDAGGSLEDMLAGGAGGREF